MEIEIRRWNTGKVIITGEYEDIRECLEKNKISFYGADLGGANLQGVKNFNKYLTTPLFHKKFADIVVCLEHD